MDVYLLVTFIAVVVFIAIAGLMVLDAYLEKKRDTRLRKIICNDVIPTAEIALEAYTKDLMDSMKKMADDWMKLLNTTE